jgi:hypothetical protein
MYTWIRATTVTLTELLRERFGADPNLSTFFGSGGPLFVSPKTPPEMRDDSQLGLSVWLYHLLRDEHLLNHPPRRLDANRVERRRLPLRLHYLMTPVVRSTEGEEPGLEQAIIGKVLQVFHDTPLISGVHLRDDLVGSGLELAVRLETLGLEEITRVWDALEQSYQLCISYEVSVTLIASYEEARSVAPVAIVQTDHGVVAGVEPHA